MKISVLAATALALGGCAATLPADPIGPDPADSAVPVAAPRYVPVTSGTADYRPVEPKPWRDMNDRVAPRRTP